MFESAVEIKLIVTGNYNIMIYENVSPKYWKYDLLFWAYEIFYYFVYINHQILSFSLWVNNI